ncbi:hypothetical protein [Yoonia sp. SS1-5]|uniref:Uncharacterized protein n=1 Tax=Yoonia rhodophyticola TaxID=3137370 RepID=A0AAN0M6E7_9RHOB
MIDLPKDVVGLLHKAVKLSNPTSLHALDEKRFADFFHAVAELDVFPTAEMIDKNWPSEGVIGLGGDPAKSDYVQDKAYQLLQEWLESRTNA